MDETKQIIEYYEGYDEWDRLERHKIEFEITKRYLDKYITENSTVLDIGGGPGRYSIYLALKGHKVTLLDLTKKHIDIAKEKAREFNVNLEGYVHGNALKLSDYGFGQFDVILLMGPLYHLTNKTDREKAVKDAMALLKPGGIFIASFISAYAPLVDSLIKNAQGLTDADKVLKYLSDGKNDEDEGFTSAYFIKPEEAINFMASFGLTQMAFAGVEGFQAIFEHKINELPENVFQQCVELIYKLSEDIHTFAYCAHYLYVGRK